MVGMTQTEAQEYARKINDYPGLRAEVERILPEWVDPILPEDHGWDVLITNLEVKVLEV